MLREVKIKEVYNSEDDNILEDFYIPALQNSILYDRAVGYFDAKVLTAAARGLACFVDNGGKIRLIVGATLTEEEYEAIARGYNEREIKEKLGQQLSDSINKYEGNLFDNQLNTLSWFIENNRLDIKIALRRGGIYHEKIGVMTDENGDSVVFQGSANETRNALSPYNYESINVFKSWLSEFSGHITPHVKKFETLWNDNARNTKVLNFTDITKSVLASRQNGVSRPSLSREIELWQKELEVESPVVNFKKGPHVPEMLNGRRFRLRRHQRDALNSWKKNNFRGIFELATGAGKTITAIYGAVKLYESRKRLFLVISAPYQSLADQWSDNLRLFNISPIVCYGGEAKWFSTLTKKIVDFEARLIDFVAIIVVDATLSSNSRTFFNSISTLEKEHGDHFLFVGDECHHHGASITAESLPENASMRMGLSATPDRGDEDQEGNDNLNRYYGDCIASYTLKDALDDDVLTPYEYHLIEVSLSSDEAEEYISLSKKISRLIAVGRSVNGKINPNALNVLLSKRARLINGTKNKPIALKEL